MSDEELVGRCPDADELANAVRILFADGKTAGGITHELSNFERYCVTSLSFEREQKAKNAARIEALTAELAKVRAERDGLRETLAQRNTELHLAIGTLKELKGQHHD